jgi:hypothetical protein
MAIAAFFKQEVFSPTSFGLSNGFGLVRRTAPFLYFSIARLLGVGPSHWDEPEVHEHANPDHKVTSLRKQLASESSTLRNSA